MKKRVVESYKSTYLALSWSSFYIRLIGVREERNLRRAIWKLKDTKKGRRINKMSDTNYHRSSLYLHPDFYQALQANQD